MKARPGQKICSSCDEINGVRAFECKNCGTALKKGDLIRVIGGSGTYYISESGDKHYFTDRGKYIVSSIDKNGIVANGPCGMCYLYMGKKKRSKLLDTMWNAPHKIILLQNDADERSRLS